MKQTKKIKAWAIVSQGGVLVGGGDKFFGYTELCIYRTEIGAKKHLNPNRKDKVVPCEIRLLEKPKKSGH